MLLSGLITFVTIKIAIELYANLNFKKPHPGRGPNIAADKFKSFTKFMDAPWQTFVEATIVYMRSVLKEVLQDEEVNIQG